MSFNDAGVDNYHFRCTNCNEKFCSVTRYPEGCPNCKKSYNWLEKVEVDTSEGEG